MLILICARACMYRCAGIAVPLPGLWQRSTHIRGRLVGLPCALNEITTDYQWLVRSSWVSVSLLVLKSGHWCLAATEVGEDLLGPTLADSAASLCIDQQYVRGIA